MNLILIDFLFRVCTRNINSTEIYSEMRFKQNAHTRSLRMLGDNTNRLSKSTASFP